MMRAAAPGADIAKITDVKIEILEPKPASLITRAGDPVDLRFRVSKPEVRVANLTLQTEGRTRKVQLRPAEPGIFKTTLHPNRSPIDYALAAGDAETPSNQIDPHTPPVILDFNKRYDFPSYLDRQSREIRERDGHLKAIEGTTVRLHIKTDQPSVGEIQLTMGGERKAIALAPVADGNQLSARVPLTDSGSYRIHLTGARSKLPAEFAPTYQITAFPDKAPRIRLLQPESGRVVQPDAVIAVQAHAEDDLGIARIEQWLSRNGGEDWETFPIATKPGRQTPVAFSWDLLKHNLEAGDLITTKLVAFDGRGEIAESREVDLTINFRDLDPERLTGLRARERAFTVVEELQENSSKIFEPIKETLGQGTADLSKLYEMDREAWSAMGRLRTPLQSVLPGRDAYNLNLAARSVAVGRHTGIRQAIKRASFARSLKDRDAQAAHYESCKGEIFAGMRRYTGARSLLRAMIAEEISRVALGDFLDLRRQTRLLLPEKNRDSENQIATPDELRRYGRVLGLTLHRAEAITELMAEFDVSYHNPEAKKLHQVAEAANPRLKSLALDLETLRADDRKSRSSVNQLGEWWQLGAIPFVNFDESFRRQFAPELAIELNKSVEGKRWQKIRNWEEGTLRELAKPGTVVYLFRTITASEENEVEAAISCREGVSVWVNGEVWVENRNLRSSNPQKYRLKLRPGQNNLLVKLVNRRHPHPFSLQIANGRTGGDVDRLATEDDKLQFLSRETKAVLDDTILALQPVVVQLAGFTEKHRADKEREAAETRALASALGRYVSRSIYYGINRQKREQSKSKQKGSPRDRDYLEEIHRVVWTPHTDALDSFAWLDETRPDADAAFSRATGILARALEAMRPEFAATEKATKADFPEADKYSPQTVARRAFNDRMRALLEEFVLLERVHEIREMERAVRELTTREEWRSQSPEPRTRHPFEWRFIASRLESVGLKLSQGTEGIEAGSALLDIVNSSAAKQVSREMEKRSTSLARVANIQPQLTEIRGRLEAIIDQLKERENEAFALLKKEAPGLEDLMKMAAESTRRLETETRKAVVEIAEAEETVAFARTRQLFLEQQKNDRLVRNVMNALRQDANSQNVLLPAGRERSRDIDAALEWIRFPAKLSATAYEDALFAESPREQRHFLEDGGITQGTIANRIESLRRHFEALDKGESVAAFRAELRELELEFEIRERLDREYGQLERVAKMAHLRRTSELVAALEGELAENGAMQRELDSLTRNAAQDALTNLQQAAMAEAEILETLRGEAVRQGETRSAMTKAEIAKAKTKMDAEVSRLRRRAEDLRESHLSLRTQHQQLRQRRDQFEKSKADFLEIETAAIGAKGNDLAKVVEILKQNRDATRAKLRLENSDLAKLDFTAELTALKSALATGRKKVAAISEIPTEANVSWNDSLRLFDSALDRFPAKHAGEIRVASELYQRSNEIRNAAARLEAASESTLHADQRIRATETKPAGQQRKKLDELVGQFRNLVKIRMPSIIKETRAVGATDAATNHTEATKDTAAAAKLLPDSKNANLLSLSQNLDQMGRRLKDAGSEMIRASRVMQVQVESPAKVAYSDARKTADDIRRIENQARQQLDLAVRAINSTRPREKRTLPEKEVEEKKGEAEAARKLAAELTRQAKRMTAQNKGKVEKTKEHLKRVEAAKEEGNEVGKLAQKLGDEFRDLAEEFETRIESLAPRENSTAGRTAKRIAGEAKTVSKLAEQIEALALRINPNVHTPSEAEVAARRVEEALEKATALIAEESELKNGPRPDDFLIQIAKGQENDAEAHDQLARAEKKLRELKKLAALPEPDPNPERAKKAILSAAEKQSPIISQVSAAGGHLLRAAVHERRLGHQLNAEKLGGLAKTIHELGGSGLSRETEQMRAAKKVLAAAEIAERAEGSIRDGMEALRAILFPEATVDVRLAEAMQEQVEFGAEPLSRREAEVSERLARALFQVREKIPEETLLAQLEFAEQGMQIGVDRDFEEVSETLPEESDAPETTTPEEQTDTPPEPESVQPENMPTQAEDSPTEPENRSTQPENSPQPEDAPTQPEDSPTQPEDAPTEPENMPTQPEDAPMQPEDSPTQPENAPTQPENAPTQPENAPTEPENMPTQPEDAPMQPEDSPTQPENAPTQPENAPTQPENAPAEPENMPTQPEDAPTQPEDSPTQPENAPTQPENAPTQPENAPTQPENAPTQPENAPTQPENAPTQPENAPAQPENAPTQPENAPTQPENAPTQPENAPAQPENAPTQPENAPTQPENAPTQPENAPTQPENAPTQPENAPTQPENAPTQPENAPTQPENAPTQPENAPSQPENAPTQPQDAAALPPAEMDALPVSQELAEAIAAVAETQARALNAERNDAPYFLPAVELDETVIERDSFSDDLDRLSALRDRNWNAFREEEAKQLSLGNDGEINGIYRDAIEAYFRVITRATNPEQLDVTNER